MATTKNETEENNDDDLDPRIQVSLNPSLRLLIIKLCYNVGFDKFSLKPITKMKSIAPSFNMVRSR